MFQDISVTKYTEHPIPRNIGLTNLDDPDCDIPETKGLSVTNVRYFQDSMSPDK